MLIEQPSEALRTEAVAALSVFGLENYPQLVGEIYQTPTNGMSFLELRPLGSKSGWENCTRHMRYIHFIADLCEWLRQHDCDVVTGYSLTVFDDHGVQTSCSGSNDDTSVKSPALTEMLSAFASYDRTQRTFASSDYGSSFGPVGAPDEIRRIEEAAHRVLHPIG
jgi:hypothetical protein